MRNRRTKSTADQKLRLEVWVEITPRKLIAETDSTTNIAFHGHHPRGRYILTDFPDMSGHRLKPFGAGPDTKSVHGLPSLSCRSKIKRNVLWNRFLSALKLPFCRRTGQECGQNWRGTNQNSRVDFFHFHLWLKQTKYFSCFLEKLNYDRSLQTILILADWLSKITIKNKIYDQIKFRLGWLHFSTKWVPYWMFQSAMSIECIFLVAILLKLYYKGSTHRNWLLPHAPSSKEQSLLHPLPLPH